MSCYGIASIPVPERYNETILCGESDCGNVRFLHCTNSRTPKYITKRLYSFASAPAYDFGRHADAKQGRDLDHPNIIVTPIELFQLSFFKILTGAEIQNYPTFSSQNISRKFILFLTISLGNRVLKNLSNTKSSQPKFPPNLSITASRLKHTILPKG